MEKITQGIVNYCFLGEKIPLNSAVPWLLADLVLYTGISSIFCHPNFFQCRQLKMALSLAGNRTAVAIGKCFVARVRKTCSIFNIWRTSVKQRISLGTEVMIAKMSAKMRRYAIAGVDDFGEFENDPGWIDVPRWCWLDDWVYASKLYRI